MHFINIILALVFSTSSVLAGETLHLKSGAIQPGLPQLKEIQALGLSLHESEYFILQFKNPVDEAQKKALRKKGVRLFTYIPDDAFLVGASYKALDQLRGTDDQVSGFVPFLPKHKISESLKKHKSLKGKTLLLLVSALSQDLVDSVTAQVASLSQAKIDRVSGRRLAVQLPAHQLWALASLQGVEWIENYPEVRNQMLDLPFENQAETSLSLGDYSDLSGYESGTLLMNFPEAWIQGLNGKGQKVAVADTGLDSGKFNDIHVDFKNGVHSGHHFGLWATSWEDPMGHGTHVAGSVASRGVASGGMLRGGAYGADLVAEGMWSPMMNNLTVPPQLKDLFDKAYEDGARIHTNSWGSPRNLGAYDGMAVQVDEYMWEHPDMLILFAAGNSGVDMDKDGRIDNGSVSSPGTAKNTLTVGASENFVENGGIQVPIGRLRGAADKWGVEPIASDLISDNANGIAMFSSRGPALDGRIKPDVVAPGTNVLSTRSYHKDASPLWGEYNRDYVYSGGTSMSTPLVAGAAAVLRQYLQDRQGVDTPSAALMKGMLMHTATDLFPGQFGESGEANGQEMLSRRPNNEEGYGLVDIDRATSFENTYFVDEAAGVAQGQMDEYEVIIGAGRLQATLIYTDAPGSPNASVALVNDLDLELVAPNGAVFKNNSRLNNSELLEFEQVPAGRYTLRVKGHRVPKGRDGAQPYALVVSSSDFQ